jgi:heterodisulfide reductase subunit C
MKKTDVCNRHLSIKSEIKALEEELEELKKVLRVDLEDDFRKNGSAVITYGNYTVSLTEQTRALADGERKRCLTPLPEDIKM